MKKFRLKNFKLGRTCRTFIYATVLLIPLMLLSSQIDESLVDDVTAMITVARKIPHTTFLLDTSESMNQFAFSDYINTCDDSLANINHAIALCDSAYNQCRTVESNAMCGVNLGCGDILDRCNTLRTTRVTLTSFCTKIGNIYDEPGRTTTIADPLGGGMNDAKKFVGPWDPARADYLLDLCFYNWSEDTNGDVLDMDGDGILNSQHYTNPDPGAVDRRDWDCLTDGVEAPQPTGGLWLNWKYATSLDAVKIILADTHQFGFAPRARGERKCMKTEYFPYKDDHILGKICYREFETNPVDPATFQKIKDQVQANWYPNKFIVADANCPGTDTFQVDTNAPTKDTVVPNDPLSVTSNSVPCDICYDYEGNEVDCEEYMSAVPITNDVIAIAGVTATVDYSCCSNFECADPKCRDDDTSCRSDGGACVLGYYSDFDQDQNHCCDMLECIEEADPATCAGGGTYLPGPGNDFTVSFEDDLNMPVLVAPDEYSNVTLTVTVTDLTFSPEANVDKVIVSIYYGCNNAGETPSTKIGEKTYTSPVVAPGDDIISTPVDLEGCEEVGYKFGGTMQLFHSGADFSSAVATMDLRATVNYDSGSDQPILVLDPAQFYYYEYRLEATGAASDKVNEYECKTTMYHKQSMVVSGGSGSCPSKHPSYAHCVYPDHMTIAADQWGNPKKTACSWLCRDDAVYDDVWKCRAFFVQMDDPARGGSGGAVTAKCNGDDPDDLKDCCIEINAGAYQYLSLEPPETVKFAAAGPSYNCSVSGFEEGETSDGDRTFTSAYMAEVIEGHIKELGDSSYRLNIAGYISPYNDPSNKWYSDASMINSGECYFNHGLVSVFETGKTGSRDIACIYDLLNNFEGEDCMDCLDLGCCSVDIGGEQNMCDYPSFWMKIANTQGGNMIYPATELTGGELANFQNLIKGLEAKGGSSVAETLYDVWRYHGGMYAVYDTPYVSTGDPADPPYTSPFQGSDPQCFENTAVIISGGQPQFDDNYSISTKTTQVAPADVPYVEPDALDMADPANYKPYVETNWYLTALEEVANWVHTKDFYHINDACKLDNNANIYGYEVGAAGCTTATDVIEVEPGVWIHYDDVIEHIHSVAIGDWALAPLYNNPNNNYLEASVLQNAAVNNDGEYFGLTAEAVGQGGGVNTFNNLTELFNEFCKRGSDQNVASGRPHWTSSLVQSLGAEMKVKEGGAYSPGVVPVDNTESRFWFGNLKKYTVDDASSGCNLEIDNTCNEWSNTTIPIGDCFTPGDTGADITRTEFKRIMAGGVAYKLEQRLDSSGISCSAPVGAIDPCYTSGARNIIYDNGTDILQIQSANPTWFQSRFAMALPGISLGESVQILDYIYGYDAFDYDNDGNRNQVRYYNTPTISVLDPFLINFDSTGMVDIRPLLMGGIVHSKPLAIDYNDSDTTRIFVGANDGMFHSFDQDGNEVFAYIPMPALPALTDILNADAGFFFNSSVDGPIALQHIDYNNNGIIDGEEQAYLIFGYRRGAKYYTVIDISELDNPKFVQHIPVEGQSWGKPLVFRKCPKVKPAKCTSTKELDYYLALPGGYDPCHDSLSPACPLNAGGHLDPEGNEIYIYKFNGTTYDLLKKYDMDNSEGYDSSVIRDYGWLRTSFTAAPVGINTDGKLALDTEFVYFADISSTVFRVDVRDGLDPDNWKFRSVFNQRVDKQPIVWNSGVRSYVPANSYPPLREYFSEEDLSYTKRIPIPLMTGNLPNPRASEIDEMIVFYDRYDYPDIDDPISSNDLKNMTSILADFGEAMWSTFDGWKVTFYDPITEKGITDPLIYYDALGRDNTYTLTWATYYPNPEEQCTSFGTARNYMKNLPNGLAPQLGDYAELYRNAEWWDPVEQCGWEPISVPTEIGVVTGKDAESITFSSGDDILLHPAGVPVVNPTNIIKWYELY